MQIKNPDFCMDSPNGKHYETFIGHIVKDGKQFRMYTCGYCGRDRYEELWLMSDECKDSPTGHHQDKLINSYTKKSKGNEILIIFVYRCGHCGRTRESIE